MPYDRLLSYVGEHLAGTRCTLELLQYLETNAPDPLIRRLASSVHPEVAADRDVIEQLARELNGGIEAGSDPITPRERRTPDQLRFTGDDALPQLDAIERIALAMLRRVALWDVLIAITARDPALPRLDYRGLRSRAREQHGLMEAYRLRFARTALGFDAGPTGIPTPLRGRTIGRTQVPS